MPKTATRKRARESDESPPSITTVNEASKLLKVLALGTHMTLTDEQVHFLAQVSPYVANAANADVTGGPSPGWSRESESGASGLVLEASPLFVEKAITLARAFCEWERLEDASTMAEAPGSAPKQKALVSAMIRDLTTGPFDAHYATVLEMTAKLESMLGALGARPRLVRDLDVDMDIDIAHHFGKLPPTPKEPHRVPRALVVARAMVRAVRRYNESTAPDPRVLIELDHWEIDAAAAPVYSPDGSTRMICGRNSANGRAIKAVTLMCGLSAHAQFTLSCTRNIHDKIVMTDATASGLISHVSIAWTRLTNEKNDRAAASLARFLALIPDLLIDLY